MTLINAIQIRYIHMCTHHMREIIRERKVLRVLLTGGAN